MEGADIRVPCLRSMAEAEGTMCPPPTPQWLLFISTSICLSSWAGEMLAFPQEQNHELVV